MYCERCGSLLDGTEQRCNVCGNQVQGSGIRLTISDAEEIVYNPPYSGDEEFVWNVHDFSSPGKRDTADFRWREEDARKAQEVLVQGEPEQDRLLENECALENDESLEEEIFKDLQEEHLEKEDSGNIDKFFTFSKKNEEFQQLLDREYEKIRKRADLNFAIMAKASSESQLDEIEQSDAVPDEEAAEELSSQTEPIPLSSEEIPLINEDSLLLSEEVQGEKKHRRRHTQAHDMEKARTLFFQEEEVPHQDEGELVEAEEDQHIRDIHELQEGQDIQSLIDGLKSLEENDTWDSIEGVNTGISSAEDASASSAANVHLFIEEEGPVPQAQVSSQEEPIEDEMPTRKEKKRKRGCLDKALLIILLIVMVVEVSFLGIKTLMPQSAAAEYLTKTQKPIVEAVAGWIGQIKDNFGGSVPANTDQEGGDKAKEGEGQEEEEKVDESKKELPDPTPMADKEKLIASQASFNKNIKKIASNPALGYQSQKDYKVKDINQSKAIENNVWKTTEEGKTLYYDQAVVGAIIGFNSSWIDYVNVQDKQVLNYLQKGSKADENTTTFSKAGKVTETFDLLEFGEIRQGAKGFYVWVHEEISITEKGVTTNKQHNWIYYLEPSENQMEIVNYFKFQ